MPAAIGEKINRIRDIDVLEELRDIISDLRLYICPLSIVVQESVLVRLNYLRNLSSFIYKLLFLKEELKLNELNE